MSLSVPANLVTISGKLAKNIRFNQSDYSMSKSRPIRIHFLLCERMLATSSTLPMEMLLAAESAVRSMLPSDQQRPLDIKTISTSTTPISTRTGLLWQPDLTIASKPASDLIYIPGLWRNPRPVVQQHHATLEWLREQYQNGAIISAVGTGVCFLAEAGLLDGKAATTHWHYFDQFQKDYTAVQLKRQYFITQAGNLYCAASVNSLADLTMTGTSNSKLAARALLICLANASGL